MANESNLVLIVTGDASTSWQTAEALTHLGYKVIGPASRLADALELAWDAEIHLAILDLDLAGVSCVTVAQVLTERNIPFVLVVDTKMKGIQGVSRQTAVLEKPVTTAKLTASLGRLAVSQERPVTDWKEATGGCSAISGHLLKLVE